MAKKSEYILNTAKLMRYADQEQARRVFLIVSVMLAPESDTATSRMSAQDALRSDIQQLIEGTDNLYTLRQILRYASNMSKEDAR